jgi:hypothetical protein
MPGLSMRCVFAAALLGGCLVTAAAFADDATFLGQFKKWSGYSMGQGGAMVCYTMTPPTSEEPRKVKRDAAYFLVNDWPGRKVKGEAEVVSGYQYKEGSTLTVQVGSDKFSFMVQDDGKSGSAWIKNLDDEARLIDAMKNNAQVLVTGESKRGTMTHDVYPLAGFSDALDKIHQACGM